MRDDDRPRSQPRQRPVTTKPTAPPDFAERIQLLRKLVQITDPATGKKRDPFVTEIAAEHPILKEANIRWILTRRTQNPGAKTLEAIGIALARLACRELRIPTSETFVNEFSRYLAIGGSGGTPNPEQLLELANLHGNYQTILLQRLMEAQGVAGGERIAALARLTDLDAAAQERVIAALNDELESSGQPGLSDKIFGFLRKKR